MPCNYCPELHMLHIGRDDLKFPVQKYHYFTAVESNAKITPNAY